MKKPMYTCKKCGKPCNGGGISISIIETDATAVLVIAKDMEAHPDHLCGSECSTQILMDIMHKVKGEKVTADISKEKEGGKEA